MKTLIWKEWREIRLIPVAITILFIVSNLFWIVLDYQSRRAGYPSSLLGPYTVNSALLLGFISNLVAGVLSGSGLFSSEVGSGTLSFLTMLPLRRQTIWLSKVVAGLMSVLISAVGVCVSGGIIIALSVQIVAQHASYLLGRESSFIQSLDAPSILLPFGGALLASIGCFAVAATISLLVDRTLASTVLSIITCVGLPIALSSIISSLAVSTYLGSNLATLTLVAMVLIPPVFLAASCYIFILGETLRTSKRFILLGKALACWVCVNALLIAGTNVYTKATMPHLQTIRGDTVVP